MRSDSPAKTALAIALVLAALPMSRSQAQTSEPFLSYDGGTCAGAIRMQNTNVQCNKGFRIQSALYDGPSTVIMSGANQKSTYLFRLNSPRKYGRRGDDGYYSQMLIDELEFTVDGRKPIKNKAIGACTYRVINDLDGSLSCNIMTEDGDAIELSLRGRSKEAK